MEFFKKPYKFITYRVKLMFCDNYLSQKEKFKSFMILVSSWYLLLLLLFPLNSFNLKDIFLKGDKDGVV